LVIPNENLLMKTPTNNDLSCSIFGHNLERISKDSNEMICKTCQSKMTMDHQDKIESFPFKNSEIRETLQQLYLLQNRFSRRQLSA